MATAKEIGYAAFDMLAMFLLNGDEVSDYQRNASKEPPWQTLAHIKARNNPNLVHNLVAAKDASLQGDDVLMQTCQQYADHYLRLQAIAIENEQALKPKAQPTEEIPENADTQEAVEVPEEKNEQPADTISESVLPPEIIVEE